MKIKAPGSLTFAVTAFISLSLSGCIRTTSDQKSSQLAEGSTPDLSHGDYVLPGLAFPGSIHYKPFGNHTSQFTLTVGDHEHPFGKGPALVIKEVTSYGACQVYTVMDFKTNKLSWAEPFGNPSCTDRSPTMGPTNTLAAGQPGYRAKLTEVHQLLEKIMKDSSTPAADKQKLAPTEDYVRSTLYPR